MGTFSDRLARGGRLHWIERTEYCGRLLTGGQIPWLDVGAFISWQRQAEGLIKSDVTVLSLAALCDAWLDAHPDLREAMGEKNRPLHPLRTLLANEALRHHIAECLSALGESKGEHLLVLAMPSPRSWIDVAWKQAHAGKPEPDTGADETESASMYIADFLRAFAEVELDAVMLEEVGEVPGEVADYRPVLNLAGHYHWDVGLFSPDIRPDADLAGLAFVIAPAKVEGIPTGLVQADAFWSGAAPARCGESGFLYFRVPLTSRPETVLERLASL